MDRDNFLDPNNKDKYNKKKMLEKHQQDKKDKQNKKNLDKQAIIIQKQVKTFLIITKIKKDVKERLEMRFKDVEKLKLKINKPDFCLPIKALNDFLRDFNFLFFRLKKNQLKVITPLLAPMGSYVCKSIQSQNSKDNIYQSFFTSLLHGSEERLSKDLLRFPRINKNQKELFQDRSFVNLKTFFRNIIQHVPNEWPPSIIKVMALIFDTQCLIKMSQGQQFQNNLLYLLELYTQFFQKFNVIEKIGVLIRDYFLKKIINFKQKSGNEKKNLDENICNYIRIAAFPITLFYAVNQSDYKNKQQYNLQYEIYLESQNKFFLNIMTISKMDSYLIEIEKEIKTQFSQFNWKNIYQGFLFFNIPDPYSYSSNKVFETHFQSKQELFLVAFGNSLRILEQILEENTRKNGEDQQKFVNRINDYYALFKLISMMLNLFTPQLIGQLINNLSTQNDDFQDLSEKIHILLDRNFALKLFNIVFDINKQSEHGQQQQGEESKNSEYLSDQFNPYIAFLVAEIYSKLIQKGLKNENSKTIITKITSALAFNKQLQTLNFLFLKKYLGFDKFLKGQLSLEDRNSFLNILILFILSYYNSLLITDISDFQLRYSKKQTPTTTNNKNNDNQNNQNNNNQNNKNKNNNQNQNQEMQNFEMQNIQNIQKIDNSQIVLSVEDINQLIEFLVKLLTDFILYSNNQKSEIQQQEFIIKTGSNLLKILQEFNFHHKFVTNNKIWFLQKNEVELILNQANNNNFTSQHLVRYMPFSIPFEERIFILNKLIEHSKKSNNMAVKMMIRRTHLFEDGFEAFKQMNLINLKANLRVFYIDEYGMEEKGIDAGGIFKEFLEDLSKIVFDPNYGMFKITEESQQIYPNPQSSMYLGAEHQLIYYFLGSVVGRAIYDKILIQTLFSTFFLRKMIGKHNQLFELRSLDQQMYKNLKFLTNYQDDIKDLGLNFQVNDSYGAEVDLIPLGKSTPVDNNNKFKYIFQVANYKLNEEIKEQCNAFLEGLRRVIQPEWLQMFNEHELQMLISGEMREGIDIQDLQKFTLFNGYSSSDSYIKDFWKVLQTLTSKEQNLFIKFVTSCERPPLLGFGNLNPPFTIVKMESDKDSKLPSSSTCFNRFYLPKYSGSKILKEKLVLAINQGMGFHLS